MAKKIVSSQNLYNIAQAIRNKNGTNTKYTPATMAAAINNLPFNWMGERVECINDNLCDTTVLLSSTAYSSWTPSTTAKSIKATTSLSGISIDTEHYAYLLRWICTTNVAYKEGVTPNTVPLKQITIFDQQIYRRPSNLANVESETHNYNVYSNAASVAWMKYYNSSGNLAMAWSSSYGLYASTPTPAFGSNTTTTVTLTPKTPLWYARCSTTYFDTSKHGDIDTENTTFNIKGKLYRMDADCCMRQRYDELVNLINA